MIPASEINKIIVRQLQRHKLEYEIDLDPNQDNQEVVFCYDENFGQQRIFRECSEEELTLLFSALIENNALQWDIALEIAKLLPEKGHLIEDKFSIDDWDANNFYSFNQMLLAAWGRDQKYESEIIKLLDAVPVGARDGLFMACKALNTPAIFCKLIEKFTLWIKADPDYGNGTGEGQFLKKFIVLWQNTQDRELVNEFAAFCRKNWHYGKEEKMIVWNIAYILYLFGNIAMLLFDFPGDAFSAIVFLPLLVSLWLAGMIWAIILPEKAIWKKERRWYWTFLPLFCIIATAVLHFLPLPWHIWNAQLTYLGNRAHYREVIKNPPKENLISQTRERTVIGFQHRTSMLTRYENKIVYISDDALPQKELFPLAESVKIYRKLSPKWYYVQIEY